MKTKLALGFAMFMLVFGLAFAATEDQSRPITLELGSLDSTFGISGFTYSPMSDLGLSLTRAPSRFSFTLPGADFSLSLSPGSSLSGAQVSAPSIAEINPGIALDGTVGTGVNTDAISGLSLSGLEPQSPDMLSGPEFSFASASVDAGLSIGIGLANGETVKIDIATGDETTKEAPQETPTSAIPSGIKYDIKGTFEDFNEQVGSSAYGFNWALKAALPEWYEWMVMKLGQTYALPESAPAAFCSVVKDTGASKDTMVGAKLGELPALQLQAWRSTVLKYPEDQPDGRPEGDLWYLKITFRYSGIIDPLLVGNKEASYTLALEGSTTDGRIIPIDLAPDDETNMLELNQGTVSVGGDNSWTQYVYEPIDEVCLKFSDPELIIDPYFKLKLQAAGYGSDRFCTKVVVVDSTTTNGLPFYEYLDALE